MLSWFNNAGCLTDSRLHSYLCSISSALFPPPKRLLQSERSAVYVSCKGVFSAVHIPFSQETIRSSHCPWRLVISQATKFFFIIENPLGRLQQRRVSYPCTPPCPLSSSLSSVCTSSPSNHTLAAIPFLPRSSLFRRPCEQGESLRMSCCSMDSLRGGGLGSGGRGLCASASPLRHPTRMLEIRWKKRRPGEVAGSGQSVNIHGLLRRSPSQ